MKYTEWRGAKLDIFSEIIAVCHTDKAPVQSNYRMHMHDNYEIYCFISGNAKYAVEGMIYPLSRGDILLMRRSESHHLVLISDAVYQRMVVNFAISESESYNFSKKLMRAFNERPLGKFNRYPAALLPNTNWLYYLERICSSTDPKIKNIYLAVFLEEISENFEYIKSNKNSVEIDKCAELIRYINRHLTDKLSLSLLSDRFYLSKSQLNRNFKQATGSTIWEYIKEKRLLMAKELIARGEKPINTYLSCGFEDYANFYRAYRNRFGISPSQEKEY